MKIKSIWIALMVGLVAISACSRADEPGTGQEAQAADFKLMTIQGEEIVLSEILKKKQAVLLFWATWCPHCRKEIPKLEKFYQENKDKVSVIAIDVNESKTRVENFTRKMQISYPIALDTDGTVAKSYQVRGIPTIVAVSRDSKIIYYGHSATEMLKKVEF